MLKKNIAKTMAAATVLTAAAPMANVVFADVMDTTQAEEIKALKEKVYGVFNAKYTQNPALLNDAEQNAGKSVFDQVELYVLDKNEVIGDDTDPTAIAKTYADFVTKFDKAFSKLNNGQKIMVTYTSTENARVIEKEEVALNKATIVDYAKGEFGTITANNDSTGSIENVDMDAVPNFDKLEDLGIKGVKFGTQADGKTYAKLPISDGKYITVFEGDTLLDLNKPKFKVVDGYYVDAKGNNIKKFVESEDIYSELSSADALTTDEESLYESIVDELVALGGVVEGYYENTDEPLEEGKTISGTYAIVKKSDAAVKEDLTVGDIYEASTGRLTKKGNELVKTIHRMVEDEENNVHEDNLRGKLSLINKAGEVVYSIGTPNEQPTTRGIESDAEDAAKILQGLLEEGQVVKAVVVFETTKDENSQDNPEWVPAYEATITEGRNERFADLVTAFEGDNKMPLAAGMNRYETAVETSRNGWDTIASDEKHVVLVSGESSKLVDGLTATPLAASLNEDQGAPILLTKANELPKETIKELVRLEATHVTIVGGTSSVSDAVVKELKEVYGIKVERLGGTSRYETSMAVANKMAANLVGQESAKFDQVFVVGGKGEADALSAAAIAGQKGAPILLTPADKLDADAKHFINKNVKDLDKETDVFVVGGKNSVSAAVQTELVNIDVINDLGNKVEVKRLAGGEGTGRQETNAAVIEEFARDLNEGIVVAKSDNKGMVDALSAGAFAAANNSHIVLATNTLVDDQEDALKSASQEDVITTKVQVGYGIGESVIKFVNNLFKR